jgi:hypothetical protein
VKPAPGQQSLFPPQLTGRDAYDVQPDVPLNSSVPDHERPRLSAQHSVLLDALRDGPKTNLQLGMICQRFGARVHELRRAGHQIERETIEAGIYRYTLIDPEMAKS